MRVKLKIRRIPTMKIKEKLSKIVHEAIANYDFEEAIDYILKLLIKDETHPIKSYDEIGAVGHRIVHGGEKFASSVLLTKEVLDKVVECTDLLIDKWISTLYYIGT